MSTDVKNIKRNSLDYILTDILPVEIPEQFTYRKFYEYLQSNRKILDNEIKKITAFKNNTNEKIKVFENSKIWKSMPCKFSILKNTSSSRELNILNPMAALEIHYFIESYQREILSILNRNNIFSLRTHRKNNNLYYKSRKSNITKYFAEVVAQVSRGVLEQSGSYFDLKPYSSIIDFTQSDEWFNLNLKFKYFARIDYKSCFDSIYTHSYKWLICKDINDSTQFKNTNIYTTIDRLMQNINAGTSNGIAVGPEFSRLIAEILLQNIDTNVYSNLMNNNYIYERHYSIKRYVDDVFIFSESEELLEIIISNFDQAAQLYLLKLNEMKSIKEKLPFVLSDWLNDTNQYATYLSNSLFHNRKEMSIVEKEQKPYIFKEETFYPIKCALKRNFNDLICKYNTERQKIVAYSLSTILKRVSKTKVNNQFTIFKSDVNKNIVVDLLDIIFYIYSHFLSFDNTQKVLSIISYINDEVDLKELNNDILQKIILKYSFIFESGNPNDLVNLLLLCADFKIEIGYQYEKVLIEKIKEIQNPLTMAAYLMYSKYNERFFSEIRKIVDNTIKTNMDGIRNRENVLMYKEFWWLLIFNKCPYISEENQKIFSELISGIGVDVKDTNIGLDSLNLFKNYLSTNPEQFFIWDISNIKLLKQITYRTHERTIFKNYKYPTIEFTSVT
ncbi:MAG: RNA-directed DNA polymerase [Anaerofustis sp.]